jgi:hypothetical protein
MNAFILAFLFGSLTLVALGGLAILLYLAIEDLGQTQESNPRENGPPNWSI